MDRVDYYVHPICVLFCNCKYDVVGPIHLGRGLRQGNPLSSYLFIIGAKGLSAFIKREESKGDLLGVKVCRGAPIISHLLFPDDNFLFFRANVKEANVMKKILHDYEQTSRQPVNLQKSEIFSSNNVSDSNKDHLASILGVQMGLGSGKYLGLPSLVGCNRRSTFNYLKDRVWKKMNSWSGKSLSKGGCEVLLKAMLQSIPAYCMSIFQGLCLREEDGTFMLAKTAWNAPVLNVEEGEAMALLMAIQLATDIHLERVIFEIDCKSVVDKFKGCSEDIYELGAIINLCM